MKKVLLLGASGLIAPHIIPGLTPHYDLKLADIKPHPDGTPVEMVDVTRYEQVLEAAEGVDAIMNFTVLRHHPEHSFHVNTWGAYNVMKAAATLGIKKVIHTGPAMIIYWYDHDFDVTEGPHTPSTGYYFLTKHLSYKLVKSFAQTCRIHTPCFLFYLLGPRPENPPPRRAMHPYTIVYDDLVHACRLGLEIETVEDYYQEFNLHSYLGHGKYSLEKAKRMLGYEPQTSWHEAFRRRPETA
jgi:nucleoside-diphosphate-sugar epimerase